MHANDGSNPRGQVIIFFGLTLFLFVFAVGLVIDGGLGLAQRRAAQNAADFAALAGARVVAQRVGGDTTNGSDANVVDAISKALVANGNPTPAFGPPDGPRYVNASGALVGFVGSGMPADAIGVQVAAERSWDTHFLPLFGIQEWSTKTSATAIGGFSSSAPVGPVFPAGIAHAFFQAYPVPCEGEISTDPSSPCYPKNLTPGNLNVPGGFGWLKFGCSGYGLGQEAPANAGGCRDDKPFLQSEIGPPGNSFGCCTEVGLPGSEDRIGSLPGNKASADCSYYVDNEIVVTVPIWDTAGGTGSHAWYHIIGFAGFQITDCPGAKNLEGVWRRPIVTGPVSSTPSGPAGIQALGVQLTK